MAKEKKEKLSLEELLEQALVKEEDRPYEVPSNWDWVKLVYLIKDTKLGLVRGSNEQSQNHGYNYLKMNNITSDGNLDLNNLINVEATEEEVKNFKLEIGDFLFNTRNSRELVGKNAVIKNNFLQPMLFNNNIVRIRFNKAIRSNLINLYFNSPCGYIQLDKIKKVTTNVAAIYAKNLNELAIPLPPLAEQQRIVDVIESLFEKLDAAKELVQNALDSFENRKAAILHKAFTGELTAKWRQENGVSLDEWEILRIKEITMKLNQGWSPKCEGFPASDIEKWGVIKTTAIQHMQFVEEENKQLPDILEPRTKHELKVGDILITRAGPRTRVGVCCMIKQVRPRLLLCDKAYRFNAKPEKVMAEYLVAALNTTDKLDEINRMKTGISDSGVNLTQNGFSDICISVPSLPEQKEIVNILDKLFNNEQQAKELCDIIEKIDLMKKSILARAFRGELGTNDPAEESAELLLKEVLKEKMSTNHLA